MTLKVNRENTLVTFHFGHKILFDGYLMTSEFLCDGHVIDGTKRRSISLIINSFLCDGYVIDSPISFDSYLIKKKL